MEEWLESRAPRRESQQTHTTTDSQSSHPAILGSPEQMIRPLLGSNHFGESVPYPVVFRRNNLGRLRPFGPDGEEILPTSETLVRTTPPRTILAVSPNSKSQSLRRKAIHDQFEDGEVKRVRLDYDGSHSSLITNSEERSQPSYEQAVIEQPIASDITSTPAIETEAIPSSTCAIHPLNPDIHPGEYWANDPESYEYEGVVFDHVDGIFRCERCGHELWGGPDGSCTGNLCDALDEPPYFTVVDGDDIGAGTERDLMRVGTRRRPGIAVDEETDELLEGERRRSLVGYCLDDDSSAYDSQDSANSKEFHDLEDYDYEDSFIDDPDSEDEGDDGSSQDDDPSKDEEPDYEAMYNQVRAQYDDLKNQQNNLVNAYSALHEEYRDLRREVGLYSSEDDENDEMDELDELDEDGVLVVDVTTPNPVVTEIVVAQAREQSQESEVSEDRLRARAEAFESAQDGSGWHEISLMSTTGNHTYPEVEL
ncbi:hypothetical protein BDZ45DRAFT_348423 [Acephala macrosclerotiorum]|nr:hypothetical protein BDZ45DRAFT_348423 [Acephala macrosclerotiorum]